MTLYAERDTAWPLWRKIIFRFFFIYLLLFISPWMWLIQIPGVSYVLNLYYEFNNWIVSAANSRFFHIHSNEVHGPVGGSGDTSQAWAEISLYLIIAVVGCFVWSILDRKRNNYVRLNYWLCLFVRYNIAIVALTYGILKIFGLQMPFPLLSQLATPLGDFLPMRLSWLFIGYSFPYQFFSGLMEVIVGILLLYRRTATMGVLVGTAVFINVMVLNLFFDIPVKLYAIHIVLLCLFLVANEADRISCFFMLNKPAAACNIYEYSYPKKWMRVTRIILKLYIIIMFLGFKFYESWDRYKQMANQPEPKPFKSGVYDVVTYAVNKDTLLPLITDTIRWQDFIFEKGGMGSVKSNDTSFRIRYNRGYFGFTVDSATSTINFKKFSFDNKYFMTLRYEIPDSATIKMWGKKAGDSLYVELKKSKRHFQLAEKQFHWISEANR
jgi:hypothetical protein